MSKAKEYLNEAREQERKVNRLIEQYERLEVMVMKTTSVISDMPRASSKNTTSNEVFAVKLIDLSYEINQEIDKLVDMKRERNVLIEKIEDAKFQDVLFFRYLLAMKWENVAERMEVSERYAYTLHGNALLALEKIMSE